MDPVGYKRVNKRTGHEIDKDNIVKGFEYEDGKYVIVSPEEIEAIYPRTTQTIEIQSFIDANEIPFVYLERPYYVAPINKGEKVYALLREVLIKTHKVGLAKVVIATKQHLAVLVPSGKALVLNLLRWGDEVKTLEGLDLPPEGVKGAKISPAEMKMAEQLVGDMSGKWNPDDFKDEFKHAVMKIVDKKVKAGDTETVLEPEEEPLQESANVVDLTKLLQRSLKGGKRTGASGAKGKPSPTSKAAAKKSVRRRTDSKTSEAPVKRKKAA
jgi:DNA end-binding protein Ku